MLKQTNSVTIWIFRSLSHFFVVGEERVIWLKFHIAVHHQRNSGQELKESRITEERADAEALEGIAFWSAPHGLLDLLSCRTQDHSFTQVLSHLPWAIQFPINN